MILRFLTMVLLTAALCPGVLAVKPILPDEQKFKFRQTYQMLENTNSGVIRYLDNISFTVNLKDDFSWITADTKFGVKIGDLSALSDFGDEDDTVSFSTISEALDIEKSYPDKTDSPIRCRIRENTKDGSVTGAVTGKITGYKSREVTYISKADVEKYRTKKSYKVNMTVSNKRLNIAVKLNDKYKDDDGDQLIEFMPVNYQEEITPYDPDGSLTPRREFDIPFGDISIFVGGGTNVDTGAVQPYLLYTVTDLNLTGKCRFDGSAEMTLANGGKFYTATKTHKEIFLNKIPAADTIELNFKIEGGSGSAVPGTTSPDGFTVVEKNVATNIIAEPSAGYLFDYWQTDPEAVFATETAATTITPAESTTVTAWFVRGAKLSMKVNNSDGGETTPTVGSQSVEVGEVVTLTASAKKNYYFDKWTVSGLGTIDDATANPAKLTVNGDCQVTANFYATNVGVLTFAVDPSEAGVTAPSSSTTVTLDTATTITATPNKGYTFKEWTWEPADAEIIVADPSSNSTTATVTGFPGAALTAHFTKDGAAEVTFAVDPSDGGTTNPSPGKSWLSTTTTTTITATANDAGGYRFDHWEYSDGAFVADINSATTTLTVTGTATVTAFFDTYTDCVLKMKMTPTGGGTTDPTVNNSYSVKSGEKTAISATPTAYDPENPGASYYFVEWRAEPADNAAFDNAELGSTNVTLDGDAEITAVFEPNKADLTMVVEPAGAGTVIPAEGTDSFNTGVSVPIIAAAEAGFSFVRWDWEECTIADPSDATTTIRLSGAATVTAVFE